MSVRDFAFWRNLILPFYNNHFFELAQCWNNKYPNLIYFAWMLSFDLVDWHYVTGTRSFTEFQWLRETPGNVNGYRDLYVYHVCISWPVLFWITQYLFFCWMYSRPYSNLTYKSHKIILSLTLEYPPLSHQFCFPSSLSHIHNERGEMKRLEFFPGVESCHLWCAMISIASISSVFYISLHFYWSITCIQWNT